MYYRKDIVELLASREKSEVVADLKKRNMLREDQLDHFFFLDEPLQAYNYLVDAILAAGHVVVEKFHRYLLDTDVSDYFYALVAPKGMFLIYCMRLYIICSTIIDKTYRNDICMLAKLVLSLC